MIEMSELKQPTYIFVPGKNWRLSLAEIVSFFEARRCEFIVTDLSGFFFTVATKKTLDPSLANDLGGIIKIGKVISHVLSETVEKAFLHREKQAQAKLKMLFSTNHVCEQIFRTPMEKCVFGVSLYFDNPRFMRVAKGIQRFVGSYFKEELAAQGTKAKFMGFPKDRKLPQLTHIEVLKRSLIEKSAEILFCIGRKQAYVASTISIHNPFEFQKRDIERPVQRKIFSIPPRLAKIMVNLSLCLPGKVLLDPFCGVGTILQEAMLTKAQVTGMDINPWCIKASCSNLEWIKNEYGLKGAYYEVLQGDSRNLTRQIQQETVDCIVTEPDLGPALRHFPTEHYARRIADKLKPLYNGFLEEALKALKDRGRLVLVTPYIRTRSGDFVTLNVEERAKATGFKIVCPFERQVCVDDIPLVEELAKTLSFVDMEMRHKIGREIHIFEK
jgi:tRNA G10  N-methylase Trm11